MIPKLRSTKNISLVTVIQLEKLVIYTNIYFKGEQTIKLILPAMLTHVCVSDVSITSV